MATINMLQPASIRAASKTAREAITLKLDPVSTVFSRRFFEHDLGDLSWLLARKGFDSQVGAKLDRR